MSEEAPAVNAVNYREKIVLYLPHRRAKYAHAKHLSRRDSTLLAIQKAQKRVPDANRDDLLEFVGQVSPRAVLLGHGDAPARQWFAEQIQARWPKIKIIQPQPMKSVTV